MKGIIITLLSIYLVTGCSFGGKLQSEDAKEAWTRQAETITTDLVIPWNITKDDHTFYLSQRTGSVIKVDGETGAKTVQAVALKKSVLHQGEGGFLGFILAPDFSSSREAFAYHTYSQDGRVLNRIVKLQLNQNTWVEESVLLEGIPGGRIHNGGRIKVGPDGKLYATTGDAGNPENAQTLDNLAGKILRLNLDGSIPIGNPYSGSYVYSYGHRNPQGLAWDSSGTLYSSEHGLSAHDEINLIQPGKNYGWPVIEGNQKASNMETPIFQTGNVTWAPSGIDIRGNNLYVSTLRGESIRVLNLNNKKVEVLFENAGRMRDVFIKDHELYTITNNRDGRGNPREGDDKLFMISLN